jgi:hypothetical protein
VAKQHRLLVDLAEVAGVARKRARIRDTIFEELFGPDLELTGGEFRRLLRLVTSDAHPVLRHEAALDLAVVMSAGSRKQRKRARETFLRIAADRKDPLSSSAGWWSDHPVDIDGSFMPVAVLD